MRCFIFFIFSIIAVGGCATKNDRLPILGRKELKSSTMDGKMKIDTLYHTIPDFSFTDQDGKVITQETFKDKIYVADFFFTTCPTICPIMKTQMLRVYEAYKGNPDVLLLSHTIDPKHDSVAVLHTFAERLGVSSKMWHFVTGDIDKIYDIGQNSYMITAREDPDEPGGAIHSGAFILVDKERRIRGIYDGTKKEKVDILIKDIHRLLNEYKHK